MKKTKMIVALLIALMMVFTFVLAACDKHVCESKCPTCGKCLNATCEEEACEDKCPGHEGPVGPSASTFMELDDYKLYLKADLKSTKDIVGTINTTIDAAVAAAYDAGVAAIDSATSTATARAALESAKTAIAECIPLATGMFDYTGLSRDEKTEILGLLEAYAIREGLTGVSFYSNGAYVIYNDRVVLGTENYITNYGFGVLTEGSLTGPLESESNEAWKMYYHTLNAQNPQNMNYLNDGGSETSDFYSYISASYFTVFMNATKDDYEWTTELAASDPEPMSELNASGQTNHWRFELRQDLQYSTLSSDPSRAAFNNRAVELEDFITPFKLLLNAGNAYFRGEELSKQTGSSAIVGASDYFNATKEARKGILSEEEQAFEDVVKMKAYEENGKWYLEYTLGAPVDDEDAKYVINSSLYMPIPAEFIELVGVDAYLGKNESGTLTPVDNSLSLGAYTLETWEDMQVVYKKNPNYVYADTKYQIAGVHIRIFPAALEDQNAAFEYFLNGNTDAGTISPAYVDQYVNDPRTRQVPDTSVFKLNFNALEQDVWEKFFGENGTVEKTPANNYWECEPAMSNSHFRNALSYAINRNELAGKVGRIASLNFFSSSYISDTTNGTIYNTTDAHKKAIAPLLDGTDTGGYSLELARDYFRMALDELESQGKITRGTKTNPTVIELEIAWQSAADEEGLHTYIKQYWEDAFNDESVHDGCYKLNVKFWVGNVWSDAYYKKMLVGQFDVGMGSISGSELDPLGFLEVLSSNPAISGNFTLNWAVDTNDPAAGLLIYKGMRWSYDALLESTQKPTIVSNGAIDYETVLFELGESSIELDEESVTVTVSFNYAADIVELDSFDLVIFGYFEASNAGYDEWSIADFIQGEPVDDGNGTITVTLVIPASEYSGFLGGLPQGIDLYVSYKIPSIGSSVTDEFIDTWDFVFVAE